MPTASADAALLAQARLGRTDAFEALVLRHQSLVCAITFSMLGDRGLSEDVAQETFIAAWRARDEVREPERFRAWLCSTARNLASKARRRLGRTAELPERELVDDGVGLEDGLAARESEALVWRALEGVPEAYREPLVLYYREGRSAAQVAELLGLTVAAVEQRLSRGRRHLKQEVEDLVERTLERSRPSAGFAAGVMAALPSTAPMDASRAAEAETTEGARSGSTSMITKLSKVLAVAGGMSVLGVAAHAAMTGERAPEQQQAGSVGDAGGTKAEAADASSASVSGDARSGRGGSTAARAELDDLAAARAELGRSASTDAAAAGMTGDYELTRLSAKQVTVELMGGPSKLQSGSTALGLPEPETPKTVRTIRGRVLDEEGRPVAGAVVVGGKSLSSMLGSSLSGSVGHTTGADGKFELATWETEPMIVLALHRSGWSPVTAVAAGASDLAIDLQLGPPAALEGSVTRGGAPFEAEVWVGRMGKGGFRMRVPTDEQGRYRIDRLPAGELEVSASVSHDAGLGTGSRTSQTVSLVGGATSHVDLDVPTGAHVTVEADVPEGANMMQYTLLVGEHVVPDRAALTQLRMELPAGQARQLLYGGIDLDEVMQWSDVPAGKVTLCVEALVVRDELLGMACMVTEVKESGSVHEVRLKASEG